ncbi:MAG: M24 family metallopeptidase, partial [Armatimonadota bacterium]
IVGLTREALEEDIRRRIRALQAFMQDHDLKALIALATGAPSQSGWIRYLTAAELLEDQAFVIVERDRPDPLVVLRSDAQAEWIRQTAVSTRVENTGERGEAPIRKVIDIVGDLTRGQGQIGTLGAGAQLRFADDRALRDTFPALEVIDLTREANCIRQIKSPFEVAAMREMGRLLSEGLDRFAAKARPGRFTAEVAGEIEGFLKSQGCIWGTSKYSLDERPYLFPASPGRRLKKDDIPVYEFVYSGPLGYWYILSSLFSFQPLPEETLRRLRATEDAITETAGVAVPGSTCGAICAASDRAFARHGFTVTGRHTVDCHPIGTDINDGPGDIPSDWELKENMTLAVHPASLLEGDRGFFLCDIFLVCQGGAIPLSPRRSFYRLIEA